VCGARLDRETEAAVRAAGFTEVQSATLWLDIVKRIEAVAGSSNSLA
jgi:hypothetical protein